MSKFLILNIATSTKAEPSAVTIELRPDLAPNHVARIVELATEGFYDGVPFHRVIPGFMAQGGDGGNHNGTGGSTKPNLKQEFSTEPHVRGICSMARTSDPNSANSQFFICYTDAQFLDGMYTVWGKVVEGMHVIDDLPKGEPPHAPGKIVSTEVLDSAPDVYQSTSPEITVIVKGQANTGKGVIAKIIEKALQDHGVVAKYRNDDLQSDESLKGAYDQRDEILKKVNPQITVVEEQVGRKLLVDTSA